MNSYEREVIAQRQVRHRWQMRVAAVLAGAIVMTAALWASGVLEKAWWTAEVASEPEALGALAPVPPAVTSPLGASKPSAQMADDGAVGKMRLVAVQPGRNAREGTAQIATGKAKPLTYIAGALLANGASLVEVHADHVVLKRGVSATQLYIDGASRNARAAKGEPALDELITVTAPVPTTSKVLGPETFSNLMRTAPRFDDNQLVGYQVYAGTDGGALSRLELQSGDVVTEMDGKPVTSVEQVHRGLKAVSEGASVMATVLRGSEMVIVSLDGAKLKEQAQPAMVNMSP
jgi:general secretion pathway protein C